MELILFTDQLIRWSQKRDSWGQMVRQQNSGDNNEYCQDGSGLKRACDDPSDSFKKAYGSKRSKKNGLYSELRQETKTLLLKYWTCPVSSIRDMLEFRENDLLTNPKHSIYLQSIFDDFGKDLMNMKLRDFEAILTKEGAEPQFFTSFDYGTLDESFEWVNNLLKFQFNDDEEAISNFLVSLVDIIDKRLPKCNTMVVKSPPSGGKNFFFDMVLAILLSYGQLGQANKHNVFAFQEAPNKRILIWNEPNYCSSLTDTLKMMMAGDPYTVRVKHQMDTHVKRTPLICLTNNTVNFMTDLAFRERIIKFEWKHASFLKDIECKPLPLCLFKILNKYNIEYYI
jgi:hypothetical protein